VAAVQPRTGLVREMRSGDEGAGGGRNSAGAKPDRSVSRHAVRSAASRCQRDESMPNFASKKIDFVFRRLEIRLQYTNSVKNNT